ncbi:MAG: DUF2961 domain-containing protein [Armatimonadetes bacterium]|nr:DUF2961 domain-containing protein [Armatimonadota bacterium]
MAARTCCVPLAVLLALTCGVAKASDLSWASPEAMPPVLQKPLTLLATTDPKHEGSDYRLLPPGGKATIATITGPAIIFRVWSTSSDNSNLLMDMTLDGKTERLYGKDQLGPTAQENDPLRSLDGQAYWSYVPLAVRKQVTFTARNLDPKNEMKVYLQVGYRKVSPSELALVNKRNVTELRHALAFVLKDPVLSGNTQAMSGSVTPDQPYETTFNAPALIRPLVLDTGGAPFEQVATTRLRLSCDGEVTVDAPLGALFCQYWGPSDYTSAATAVRGSQFILRFPLPVAQSLKLELLAFGGKPLASASVALYSQPLKAAPRYRFCAQYFSGVSVRGEPLHLAELKGPGIFLGSNLATEGTGRRTFAFLEGNEQIYVDGATKPTHEGTGTEDYFNGAWYFESGVLTRAFHGVTYKQDTEPPRVSAYRYLIPDCLPFRSSLKLDLQHGSRNGAPDVSYRAVVFWYQQPPVTIAEPVEAQAPPGPSAAAADEEPAPNPFLEPALLGGVAAAIVIVVVAIVLLRRR